MFSDKDLQKLIVPLILEQILVMLVGISDTVIVSHISEAAVAGVALVDILEYFIITVLAAVGTGGAVIISQYLGRGDKQSAVLVSGQLVLIMVVFAAGIMLSCCVFYKSILTFLFASVEVEVMQAAETYFLITICSIPFLGLYNALAAMFRSMRQTQVTLYAALLMNIVNIAGNLLVVFIWDAGVVGVAAATLLARALSALLLFYLAGSSKNIIRITYGDLLVWKQKIILQIMRIAVPNGIENGLFALGRVLVTGIVALFATTQIAANSVANSIDQIAIIVVNGVNIAMITVVGQCIGADDYGQARLYTKKLMKISYWSTAVLGITVCLLLPVLLRFYGISEETYDLTVNLVIIHNFTALLLHPTSFNLPNSLRAAGDVRFTMYTGISSMLIFRLGTAVLLGVVLDLQIYGVWIAMVMDWLARSVIFGYRYRGNKWQRFSTI